MGAAQGSVVGDIRDVLTSVALGDLAPDDGVGVFGEDTL
jgi:hypothetical protein